MGTWCTLSIERSREAREIKEDRDRYEEEMYEERRKNSKLELEIKKLKEKT